jgi:hypothetical protein
MVIEELKESLDKMYSICDMVGEKGLRPALDLEEDFEYSRIIKIDLIRFMSYIAVADGVLSWKECHLMSSLFDMNLNPQKIKEFIEENNIYSDEFETSIPITLRIFVAFDNAAYTTGIDLGSELGDSLVKLYVCIAQAMLQINGKDPEDMDESEKAGIEKFLNSMQKFIDDETESHHTDLIVDLKKTTKNNKHVDLTIRKYGAKQAVRAPKKK